MGREVRMVPKDWEHPKSGDRHIPLHEESFSKAVADWKEEKRQWDLGFVTDYKGGWEPKGDRDYAFEEYSGSCPTQYETMPDWKPEERTHFMMYETCSEGTPISPAMKTPEKLARWLADNGASAFGSDTATYKQWLATIKAGSVISAVGVPGKGIISGVAFEGDEENRG